MDPLSTQALQAVADLITGGSGHDRLGGIGKYRSGPKLETFFRTHNVELHIGPFSRVPAVHDKLIDLNRVPRTRPMILKLLASALDPRDFRNIPKEHEEAIEYANQMLEADGWRVQCTKGRVSVTSVTTRSVSATALRDAATMLDFRSVTEDFDRAAEAANTDPEDAVTSACSLVESVCKCILEELGAPLPSKLDVQHLSQDTAKHLGLSPSRKDLPEQLAHDLKQILGGLQSVAGGIGALRTHFGDAHGRGRSRVPLDPRIARLAVHAASTLALFYIETWQKRAKREP